MVSGSAPAPDSRAQRLVPLVLPGPAGPLEALLQERDARDHDWIAVVCHPHPLYGGTLHNKVVHRVASTLHRLGCAVLRFNFRGAGKSAGAHDHGVGEVDDARAALDFLKARYPRARALVAGFSFGSGVAARLAGATPGIEHLILVAPPVATSDFHVLERATVPKLVLQGTRDDVCPIEKLMEQYPGWAEPKRLIEIAGATHFFDRQLAELAAGLERSLAPVLRATS